MEYILGVLNIILLGMLYLKDKSIKEERNQFINALLSKTPEEYSVAQRIIERPKPKEVKPPDLIPETELNDKDWLDAIRKTNGQG